MQLFALDSENKLVLASSAIKQHNYFCLECQQVVRIRSGPHRHTHFYHISPLPTCRQSQKSMPHIRTQLHLLSLFPEGEGKIEMRFPQINRIADVVWLTQNLVFEIQCSPITAKEILERNKDYNSQGFEVIWILHDKRFNQWRVSAAEQFLRKLPHYFTDINADGTGIIYDQFDVMVKGARKHVKSTLTVDLKQPMRFKEVNLPLPQIVSQRMQDWRIYFSGDLVDLCLSSSTKELFEFIGTVESFQRVTWKGKLKKVLWRALVRPYQLMFQMLLERSCK